MGREPEVRIQHGAHHLQGVSAEGEVVADEQRRKSDEAAGHGADGVAINVFECEAETDGAPADEERRGVEVCDGRATFEPHPGEEARSLEHPSDPEEPESRATELDGPHEPRDDCDQKREDVENHRIVERLGRVVASLGIAFHQ